MHSTMNLLGRRLRSRNALLLVVCLAQFMVILDVAIVNVALPSIHNGLGFSTTGLQWVVNAYTLTFAGLLMLGGRSADLLARVRAGHLARAADRSPLGAGDRRCDHVARDAGDHHEHAARGSGAQPRPGP